MINWFYETHTRSSKKNGAITATRTLGEWRVAVGTTGQTTPYLRKMWHGAFRKIQSHATTQIREVLMLGLGGGGEIQTLHTYFPGCKVSVIEFDEAMIDLAHTLKLYGKKVPTILHGDAAEILPSLQQKYDLIMVDMFVGEEPSPLVTQAEFRSALARHLAPEGLLIANVYKNTEYLDSLAKTCTPLERWKHICNHLGVYRNPTKQELA